MYELSDQDIRNIAEKAAETALVKAGLMKSQVSTNEANQRYGRNRVTRWRKMGLVTPVKQGGIVYFQVLQLEKASTQNIL